MCIYICVFWQRHGWFVTPPPGEVGGNDNPFPSAFPGGEWEDANPLEMLDEGGKPEEVTEGGQKDPHGALFDPTVRFASDEERRAAEAKCAGLEGGDFQNCLLDAATAPELKDPKKAMELAEAFARESRLTDCLAVAKQDAARFRNDLTAESKSFAFAFFLKPFEYPNGRERILFAKVGGGQFVVSPLLSVIFIFFLLILFLLPIFFFFFFLTFPPPPPLLRFFI
jgi:hypothetical protein